MKILRLILLFIPLIFFVSPVFAQEETTSPQPQTEYFKAKVIEVAEENTLEGNNQFYQKLNVQINSGSKKGEEILIENQSSSFAQVNKYKKGDNVYVSYSKNDDGSEVFFITDYIRTDKLNYLFVLFLVLALLIARKFAFFSIAAMGITFLVIFWFVLPQIRDGKDPVLIAILSSIIIIPITFYLSHGFEKKTTIAMAGTFIALIITGLLSHFFVNLTRLTGTASEEALFLQTVSEQSYNLKGLLLAGILIGTLGVMDDITVAQTSIVFQLHDLKKDLSFKELFQRSLVVGKDHISSMINTLVLVYAGASLPLLLLFLEIPRPVEEILNYELLSTEIVRTLVGSIGLILAVPITTYLAVLSVKKQDKNIR